MRRSHVVLSAGVAAASLATAPVAAAEPETFGAARQGSLLVASSALVSNRNATMMGGWNNDRVACTASRRLTVRIIIDRVGGGNAEVRRRKTGRVANCAEGGPNFGFVIRAADVGLACPDGSWRPGRYHFDTNTRHHSSGLRAIGSVFFRITDPC
jgi:hypothetical protein